MRKKEGDNNSQQLFTFAQIVRNNKDIFSKRYPRGWNENENHYICKVFLGENIRKLFPIRFIEIFYEYEGLPDLGTELSPRFYQPDIFIYYRNDKEKTINISVIEIDGLVHKASKHQYQKTKWRREAIIDYFTNIKKSFENRPIIFSFFSFEPDDFLYHKLDFFIEIFEKYFYVGGTWPTVCSYEKIFL
jgi:hypothetical protein